jgi:hypothetical protein
VLALAVTVVALVAAGILLYRPWEEHYRLQPASWWAAQYTAGKLDCQTFVGGKRDDTTFWLYNPGPPPKPFWYDWAVAVGLEIDLDAPGRRDLLKGDPDAVPVLCELLHHPSNQVRDAAVYGLVQVGKKSPDAVDALVSVANEDLDSFAGEFARQALREIDPEAAKRAGIADKGP